MEPERWQEIERLCYSALNEEPSARGAFLERACKEDDALRHAVELLLAQHEKDDDFLESPAMEVAAKRLVQDHQADAALQNPLAGATPDAAGPAAPAPFAGTTVAFTSVEEISFGPYRLLEKLGEGGMGEVWLAEQKEPVRRRVALKLIKAGMDTREVVARFQSERQALAMMDHPAIAKVFEAGSTPQGRPYFVMEYVPGLPITTFADKHKLTTQQRLELFVHVCEGVQHAHQKAIIHRDLKPSNILVSEIDGKPMPRIIDFGVAKAVSTRLDAQSVYTQFGAVIGTLGYMSPEQADSGGEDIDTRTDVYSLGVILYELLAGALPHDFQKLAFDEVLRRLREDDVPKPSTKIRTLGGDSAAAARNRGAEPLTLIRQLRGDPDAIALKALEKDRKRRYASPSELAADIERYLRNEPVIAHQPSTSYRMGKYIRRHRVGVAIAAIMVLLLAGFAVAQAIALRRITRERDRANREADRANRIKDFMIGMFDVSDPSEQRGNSITAREILDKASKDITTWLAQDPEAQAQMMHDMGDVYISLGLFSRAIDLEQQSVEIRRRVLGPEHPDTLSSMSDLAEALIEDGHYAEAVKMNRELIDIERRVLGPDNPQTLYTMNDLAGALHEEGNNEEAEKMDRELLPLARRVFGPENRDTLKTMSNLADYLNSLGRSAEAEKLDRETLDIRRRVLGPEHPDTLISMNNLAHSLEKEGNYAEAEKLDRETLDIRRRTLGPEHPETEKSMSNLGFVLSREGRYAEAEKLDRETLDLRRRTLGPDHPETLKTMGNLLDVLSAEGRLPEAEKLTRDMIDIDRRVLGPENRSTAVSIYNLACIEARMWNRTEALSLLRQAVDHGLSPSDALEMENDPDLKSLHGDPRFITLVAYVKEREAAAQRPK